MRKREKEIIYFALSRVLGDRRLSQDEFKEIDNLRRKFHLRISELTFSWVKRRKKIEKDLEVKCQTIGGDKYDR